MYSSEGTGLYPFTLLISTTISVNSNKSVFGQCGPSIRLIWLSKQTICGKLNNWYINSLLLNTMKILNYTISFLVKFLVIKDNPQIIKARSENFKPWIIEFSGLSMLVRISETIRLLWRSSSKMMKDLIYVISKYSLRLKKNFALFITTALLLATPLIDVCIAENLKEDTSIQIKEVNKEKISIHSKISGDNPDNIKSSPRGDSGEGKGDKFNEWLAGLIDGDGCFLLSKKGYASLEITIQLRDKHCLYLIKQRYGGAVKLHAGDNYLRYRLHHRRGLLDLINSVNGLIRNPIRIIQLGKICEKYEIKLKDPETLTYYNGWFAGFFDSDGSIYLNDKSGQIFITAGQKNRLLLDALVELYGGQIYTMVKQDAFKWTCYKKKEILNLVNDYFNVNPCRSAKLTRLSMANKFYELRQLSAHRASPKAGALGKAWKHFLIKWNSVVPNKAK